MNAFAKKSADSRQKFLNVFDFHVDIGKQFVVFFQFFIFRAIFQLIEKFYQRFCAKFAAVML